MKEALERLARHVNELQSRDEERLAAEVVDKIISVNSKLFDQASTYNNLVVTLGYAGIFAIWNFTSDNIPSWDNALIAVLLGASLLLFVVWTVFSSNWMTFRIAKNLNILSDPKLTDREKLEKFEARQIARIKEERIFRVAWFLVFLVSVATAVIGAIIILGFAFFEILDLNFTLKDILFKG